MSHGVFNHFQQFCRPSSSFYWGVPSNPESVVLRTQGGPEHRKRQGRPGPSAWPARGDVQRRTRRWGSEGEAEPPGRPSGCLPVLASPERVAFLGQARGRVCGARRKLEMKRQSPRPRAWPLGAVGTRGANSLRCGFSRLRRRAPGGRLCPARAHRVRRPTRRRPRPTLSPSPSPRAAVPHGEPGAPRVRGRRRARAARRPHPGG